MGFTTSGTQWLVFGDITLRITGSLHIGDNTFWFSGRMRAFDDPFNFKAGDRGLLGEALTFGGSMLPGKEYYIQIRCSRDVLELGVWP